MKALPPHLHLKDGLYYARFRIPLRLQGWLSQRELQWSLRTTHLKTARQHLCLATVLIHQFFEQAVMATYDPKLDPHEALTATEKIKLKNWIEQIKQDKLREFHCLLEDGSLRGTLQAKAFLSSEQFRVDAFHSALEADHFDGLAVKGPVSDLVDVVPRLAMDFSGLNPNYNYLAKIYCEGMIRQHQIMSERLHSAMDGLEDAPQPPHHVIVHHHHEPAAQTVPVMPETPRL